MPLLVLVLALALLRQDKLAETAAEEEGGICLAPRLLVGQGELAVLLLACSRLATRSTQPSRIALTPSPALLLEYPLQPTATWVRKMPEELLLQTEVRQTSSQPRLPSLPSQ